jgi:acetyl esterase/lipase
MRRRVTPGASGVRNDRAERAPLPSRGLRPAGSRPSTCDEVTVKLPRRVLVLDRLRRATGSSIATMDLADIPAAREARLPDVPVLNPLLQRAGGWLFGRPRQGVVTTERTIPGVVGPLTVRVHSPAARPGPRPLIVHLHGGGWVLGSTESHDPLCTVLADDLGAVVVSVDYRMAPEDLAPAAADDAIAATAWLAEHASEVGADDGARVAVIGDSAGGNLAALVAIAARDGAVPPLAAQVLIYPSTDLTRSSPSMARLTDEPFLSRDEIDRFVSLYLGTGSDREVAADDPRVSPAFVEDLRGVPPALVITAEHDPMVDEGVAYATRLADAGVEVRHTTYVGVPHGFLSSPGVCPPAAQAVTEITSELRRHLGA